MKTAQRVGAMMRQANRGALILALQQVDIALLEAEGRYTRAPLDGLSLRLFPEGSGWLERENVACGEDPAVFIFYSLDELVAWLMASPAEREAMERAEVSGREEKEARDFAKLDELGMRLDLRSVPVAGKVV